MSDENVLEIDAGNSAFKWRILSGANVLQAGRSSLAEVKSVISSIASSGGSIDRTRVVSVVGQEFDNQLKDALSGLGEISFAQVVSDIAGVSCGYKDLSQLGVDRWMAIIAAAKSYSGALMIVDMGSALTIDLVNKDKQHCGGYILPGWKLMQEALMQTQINPSRIPERYESEVIQLGLTTVDAIGMGRLKAISATIDYVFDDFKSLEGGLTLVCTGGDAPNIIPHLKAKSHYVPDLVLDGLSVALG